MRSAALIAAVILLAAAGPARPRGRCWSAVPATARSCCARSGLRSRRPTPACPSSSLTALAATADQGRRRCECDLGRVARPLKDEEKGLNLSYKVFAYSPVVFVVDPGRRREPQFGQIVEIFSAGPRRGEVGARRKIFVVNREAKDSSRGELNKRIVGFKAIERRWAPPPQRLPRPSIC